MTRKEFQTSFLKWQNCWGVLWKAHDASVWSVVWNVVYKYIPINSACHLIIRAWMFAFLCNNRQMDSFSGWCFRWWRRTAAIN
jgi:hypothetical protein